MRKRLFIFALFFIPICSVFSQTTGTDPVLLLKSGNYTMAENLEEVIANAPVNKMELVNGNYYRFIQFYQIPTSEMKKQLENSGLKLISYLPKNAFITSIPSNYDLSVLRNYQVRSISSITADQKLSAQLFAKDYPSHALSAGNKIGLNIIYFSDISSQYVSEKLLSFKAEVLAVSKHFPRITLRIDIGQIEDLANLPFVQYVEVIDMPSVPENLMGKSDHRSNAISTDYGAGRQFTGAGVNVMLQDDGMIGPHIDYTGRIGAQYISYYGGSHGDHTAGTIFGAGNIDPTARGMAHGASLYVYEVTPPPNPFYQGFDSIYKHYINPGITITSTSYTDGCGIGYTSFTQELDKQVRTMPSLIHVFSAGNMGPFDCSYGAGSGWGNISGGRKQGKNLIAVGNLDSADVLNMFSSRGPAHDGRIKPDVCGVGTQVNSTQATNKYEFKTGTSMSCPGVAGTLAQLYEAYRTLNGNKNPPSALMKAAIMNSADELGNPGLDYKYGYGRINALRAVKYLEEGRHLNDSVGQGNTNSHTINVPAGTVQLRVMLYWHDFEASVNANPALVNNLNMVVTDPSATTFNPWVLNHAPNATTLNLPATRQVDGLNNVEQVTIDNPPTGTYNITVTGATVPQGPQKYHIVYEFVKDEITVTYPIGGEGISQGVSHTMRWDAYDTTGTFNVEYSANNGTSWSVINGAVNGAQRYCNWVPDITIPTTGQGLIRVSRGSLSDVSDANFSFIRVPSGLVVDSICPNAFQLIWNAVPGASAYEASILGTKYMDSIGTTTDTSFWFWGFNSADSHWVSIRALGPLNAEGRRAFAYLQLPGVKNCLNPVANEPTPDNLFLVFPNPAINAFNMVIDNIYGNILVRMTDITGRLIYERTWNDIPGKFNAQISTVPYAKGIYYLEAISEKGKYRKMVSW